MKTIQIGPRTFQLERRTYMMGILNITPDSFSDGGKYRDMESILKRTETMLQEGADIIDVGGESTRPGYTMISEEEERSRVIPVIREIKRKFHAPVSVDTYKSAVAEEALSSGADMVNDIWGLQFDKKMARTIADHHAACCLMHNRKQAAYANFIPDCLSDLRKTVRLAEEGGIDPAKLVLDPGVGFAKSYEQNLQILNRLEEFLSLGYPLLLGTSRKSVIGLTLRLPVEERVEGTLVTTALAVMKGCSFVRVHDIKENKRAIQMAEAVLYG